MNENNTEPQEMNPLPARENGGGGVVTQDEQRDDSGVVSFFRNLIRPKNDSSLRETIEEYIEEESQSADQPSVSNHEKKLISNVLNLRDMTADDVMIPRADIVAINENTTTEELFNLLSEKQYSRIPVYSETLDNVVGAVHVKDILACVARKEEVILKELVREVPIVSPAIHVLDLLLQMRLTRKHMVFVVDEFGGIDGLVTIGDVIEAIVGEIDDEHAPNDQPQMTENPDGTILVDARFDLDVFEEIYGRVFSQEEREDNDTLGGLLGFMLGRVPARGEVLTHEGSGLIFEILDADPRRVKSLRVGNLPPKSSSFSVTEK